MSRTGRSIPLLLVLAAAPAAAQSTSPPPATASVEPAPTTTPPTQPDSAAVLDPAAPEAVPAPPPPAAATVDPTVLATLIDERLAARDTVTWSDGFNLKSADGAFKLKLGGYTHFDSRVFVADDGDKHVDQFTFRRIRPELAGTVLERAEFRLLPDFAGGRVVVQDAYVELAVAAPLKLRFGKFKEPFGLERLQSATALLFVERGLPTTLVPNRDLGVQVSGELATSGSPTRSASSTASPMAPPATATPATTRSSPPACSSPPSPPTRAACSNTSASVSPPPSATNQGSVAATDLPALKTSGQATFFAYRAGPTAAETALAGGRHWRVTGQGHFYRGRFGVLAEYVHSAQDVTLGDARTEVSNDAWQVALNLVAVGGKTGFKGSTPAVSFDPAAGHWGALEVAARYHELRVGDEAFTFAADPAKAARVARSIGAGGNWILGRALRFVLDFEHTRFDGGDDDGADRATEHVVLGRVQTVF